MTTSDDRKIKLGFDVDSSNTRAGFDQVKAGAKEMAQAVTESGQQASKGLDGIGSSSGFAAAKMERDTRSLIASVQRTTAAIKAAGKGKADYIDELASQRGISADTLKPYLDQLRQAEAAQKTATTSLNKMGMSAAATSAAMRNVPAQFTDIVVSLQSGQQPMTVLLQQGGQLKDMFGGVGGAAKALGGYVAGLINPFSIAAVAVGTLGAAYYKGAQESSAYNQALILSGNAAGVTGGKLADMATHMATLSGTQGQAAEALAAFTATGQFGANSLERFSAAAIHYAKATGAAIDDTVKQFTELGKSPLDASVRLNESMNYLTSSLYQQIKALDEQGRHTEAANLAQNAFADTIDSRSAEMVSKLGLVERAWLGIKSAASGAVDKALSIGRELGPDGLLQAQSLRVTNAQNNVDYEKRTGYGGARGLRESQDILAAEREKLELLQKQVALSALRAIDRRDEAAAVKAQIGFDKETEKYKTNAVQREAELLRLAQQYATVSHDGALGQKNKAAYDTAVEKIKDQFKDKEPPKEKKAWSSPFADEQANAYAKYYGDFASAANKAQAGVDDLTASQAKLVTMLTDPVFQGMPESWRQTALQAAYAAVAIEQTDAAQSELAKHQAAFEKVRESALKHQVNEIGVMGEKAQAIEDEVAAFGLSKEAIDALSISRLHEQKIILMGFENAKGQIELIEQEIAARQRLAKAQDALSGKQEAQKAAKAAADEWKRAAEKINDSITDALMRGFESGKGFAENLRDSVVNMFKTMVLRPVVEMGVRGSLSVLGMGGMSGAASAGDAAGSVGSIGSSLSTLSSLGGLGNWLTDFGSAGASAIIKGGQIAYDAGFETIGRSMMSLSEAGNFSAVSNGLNVVGDGLGYLNAAMAASKGQWGRAAGSAIGTWFGGPIGGAIGDAVGSWVDESFSGGHEYTTGTGIAGKFSGKQFSGRNFQDWRNEGSSGFFGIGASGSSSGTNYSAIDAQQAKFMGAAYGAIITQTADFATALGASASSITGYQKDIKLALGADAEANKKAIADLFKGLADEVAATVLDSQYIREGEGAADTLARLATNLSAVNGALDTLGDGLLSVSQYSGNAASALVDNFGGLGQYQSAIAAYYQRYYSNDERTAKTREQLTKQLGSAGLAVPGSTEDYRALVNQQDLTTEAGRKTYTMLINLSGAFADVSQSADDAAKALIKSAEEAAKALIKSVRYGSYVDYAGASAAAGIVAAPRFAGGGDHYGGVRIVGENGSEVEATGPARIWNKSQMAGAMMAGSTELAARIDALRDDTRAQARSMATLQARMVKLLEVWDAKGMPEVRTV